MLESSVYSAILGWILFLFVMSMHIRRFIIMKKSLPKGVAYIPKKGSKSKHKGVTDAHLAVMMFDAISAGTISWFILQMVFVLMNANGFDIVVSEPWYGGTATLELTIGVLILQMARFVRTALYG